VRESHSQEQRDDMPFFTILLPPFLKACRPRRNLRIVRDARGICRKSDRITELVKKSCFLHAAR
jgi:hypothetical protein